MKRLLVLALAIASCVATPATSSPTPSTSPVTTASATASLAPSVTPTTAASSVISARAIAGVGARAELSPDGKWLAVGQSGTNPTVQVYDLEGKLLRRVEVFAWRWLPDSSGLFVALDAPQRSPDASIVDLVTGAVRATGLQMTGVSLSRDGRWIVANHTDGCCVSIEQREIWIAPRTGGNAKVLVSTTTPRPQAIGVLGIDAQDRLLYYDFDRILRMPVAGGTAQLLGTLDSASVLGDGRDGAAGDASPDGAVILVRTIDPLRWYFVGNDRVTVWSDASGAIVEDHQGSRLQYYSRAIWTGPHAVLLRSSSGVLSSLDTVTGTASLPFKAVLADGDLVLAHDRGRLLVVRDKRAIVLDLASGATNEIGGITGDFEGARGSALPNGGFVLSTSTTTFRID